jgi:hypothetical protein
MGRKVTPALLGLLAVALLPGCAGWIGNDRRESNAEVMILSFGSTQGELAPCG